MLDKYWGFEVVGRGSWWEKEMVSIIWGKVEVLFVFC